MTTTAISNSEILFRNSFFLSGSTIISDSHVGDFSPDNLLVPSFNTDDFFRFEPNNYIALSLPTQAAMDVFYIDRRHTFVTGNVIKIYLSNTSTAPGDEDEPIIVITVQDYQEGAAIYKDLSGIDYQFVRVEFEGSNPGLGYQELGWIYAGPKDVLSHGYGNRKGQGRKHVVRNKTSWLGNTRSQKRSEQFKTFEGKMDKVTMAEIEAIWQPLNEWAANMFSFVWVNDNTTVARLARETILVEWTEAAEWEFTHQVIDGTDAGDYYQFPLNLKEIATARPSPIA